MNRRCLLTLGIILAEILFVVWRYEYLPLADLPEHILAANILTDYDNPETAYSNFYTKRFPWNPYSSFFLFVLAVEPMIGVVPATRLYICLTLILTIVSFWWWLRVVAPSKQAQAIPASLLLFGMFFYMGLLPFLFSAPFLFFSLGLTWRLLETESVRAKCTIFLSATILLTYLSHIVTFLFLVLLITAQAVLFFRIRRIVRIVPPLVPSLVMLAAFITFDLQEQSGPMTLSYEPLAARAENLLLPFGVYRDHLDRHWYYDGPGLVLLVLALSLILAAAVYRRNSTKGFERVSACMCGLFVAQALCLPSGVAGLGFGLRAAYFAGFGLVAALPAKWSEHRVSSLGMAAICIASPFYMASRLEAFQVENRDLQRAIGSIPLKQVVQPIITEPHSKAFRTYPFQHAVAWYNAARGGVSPYLMAAWAGHFPTRTRRTFIPNPPPEWETGSFHFETHGQGATYFLVRTHRQDILADLTSHVGRGTVFGDWWVFGPN
jgi:hypothetical protein